jgi:DNA-directed RNA polymerase specialized sigma subunit
VKYRLDAKQERLLIADYLNSTGDKKDKAFELLVLSCCWLCDLQAKKWNTKFPQISTDDFFPVAIKAVLTAIPKLKADKVKRLCGYVAWVIYRDLKTYAFENHCQLSMPRNYKAVNAVSTNATNEDGLPLLPELAIGTGNTELEQHNITECIAILSPVLDAQELAVVSALYKTIGKRIGLTPQGVAYWERKALGKLRAKAEALGLTDRTKRLEVQHE